MTTRNIVPRATDEGTIGTKVKKWFGGFFSGTVVAEKFEGTATQADNAAVAQVANGLSDEALQSIKDLIAQAKQEAKEETLQANYPVGAPYVSFTDSRNPAEILGFGEWEALDAGHTLVAAGTAVENGTTYDFTAGSTGGEFAHQLTVGELPEHRHLNRIFNDNNSIYTMVRSGVKLLKSGTYWAWYESGTTAGSIYGDVCGYTDTTGGGKAHNNLPPYISCYLWRRVS